MRDPCAMQRGAHWRACAMPLSFRTASTHGAPDLRHQNEKCAIDWKQWRSRKGVIFQDRHNFLWSS